MTTRSSHQQVEGRKFWQCTGQIRRGKRMASLQELKDALRDTLAARGTLGQIQARVRAEIFHALEETV